MYHLYLKKHNTTNLKYLGYTHRKDYDVYTGSGLYWLRHIKKHGYDVTTELLYKTDDLDDLKNMGIYYSKLYNVVESDEFANLKEEAGLSGVYSEESKKKMSDNFNYEAHQLAWTEERKQQQSKFTTELNKKYWADKEHSEKRSKNISQALKGKTRGPQSEETIKKRSEALKGKAINKGKTYSMKTSICPHCGKEGKGGNMTRYHFDNCKYRESNPFGEI